MPDSNKRLQDITERKASPPEYLARDDGTYTLVIEPTTEKKISFDLFARSIYRYGSTDNDFSTFTNPPKFYFPGDVTVRDQVQTTGGLRIGILRCGSYRAYSTGISGSPNAFSLYQGTIDGSENKLRGTWGVNDLILYNINGYISGQDNMSIRLYGDTGNGRFKGNLTVDGTTSIGGNTTIGGTASITGNTTIRGTLSLTGNLSAGSISGFSLNNSNTGLTDANDAKAGATYVNCSTVANLPYSSGAGELLRIGSNQIFLRLSSGNIIETWYRCYLNSVWGAWHRNDDPRTISLSDFITPATGISISASSVQISGRTITGYITCTGTVTSNDSHIINVGTIKSAYRPSFIRTFPTLINGSVNGSFPSPVVGRVFSDGTFSIVADEANRTYGSTNYAWTNGTAFEYTL